jgi:Leucine-rich repeat (LRR) protein
MRFLTLLLGLFILTGCRPAAEAPLDPLRATTVAEALAQSNTVQNLDLFYRRLNGFPTDILVLKKLKQLNLRTCTIGRLPDEITALSQLTRLDLGQTALTNLPPAIGELSQLTHLWVNDNPLPSLPQEIQNLANLTYLNADRTQLSQLPPGIGLLSNLRWLRLNNNHLTAMPADMTGLAKNLKILYLMDNPLPEQEQNRIKAALPGCTVIFQPGPGVKTSNRN